MRAADMSFAFVPELLRRQNHEEQVVGLLLWG